MLPRDFQTATSFPAADPRVWRALVDHDLQGASFERKLLSPTYEGLLIKPLYGDSDWPHARAASGRSGLMPMSRGARALGNAPEGWEICQERREADLAALNRAVLEDLSGGVNAVLLRLDASARAGLDPDDGGLLAGTDGAMVYSLSDLDRALAGVHLEMVSINLESGAAFIEGASLLAGLWEQRGVSNSIARGAFNADPLAVLARDGRLPYCISDGLCGLRELAEWTHARYPGVTAVRVGTAAYHHAGATATQDLACAVATGVEYLRALTEGGMSVDDAAKQMRFSFAVGCGVFLATAKLRAARTLWARVIEACGGSEDARRMRMHVRTSKRVLATRDPWVNILRNSACVLAGGLGGADSIGSEPFDSVLGDASELARRLARNTHHILMDECGIHRICDAPGGSWYIESLTDELCDKAWMIFQAIEARGGMARVLSNGWLGDQIDSAFKPRARNLATRKDAVLGVSEFPMPEPPRPPRSESDHERLRTEAAERVIAQRARASPHFTTRMDADRLTRCVQMARAGATIGQMHSGAWAGQLQPTLINSAISVHPFAEPFERLRDASDTLVAATGSRPRVFLASMGPTADHLARTNFTRNVFEAGGFEVVGGAGYRDITDARDALEASDSHIAAICGSDERYVTLVPALAPALHAGGARFVVLAGNPGQMESTYRSAGVDRFVFIKCDVVRLLSELLQLEGAEL
jgi:methylmalonyl-CoA mutase